ncbi:unnamed protein product [Prorocentrum cordatum]|uniref:Uncharacterized protein n=1 Tax=Prorocentrum cordatum TaxID=2364126 RepID=A0ABN9UMW2_9DINO|nr:unnamed protein product [Polarella glacialis]
MAVAARTPARRARGLRAARGSQVVITTLAAVVLGSLPGGPLLARAGRARPPARGTGARARSSAGRAPTQLRARGGQQGWPAPHPPWQPEQPLTQPRPGYGEQVPSPHAVAAHQGLGHWGDSRPNAPREDGPPSQKQLALAEELAWQAGRAVPEDARRSQQECARVIDQLEGMVPPSQNQLAFAEELARQAGRAMPEDAFRSKQECRKFITELEAARMSRQYAVAPDSGMGRWDHARPSAPGGRCRRTRAGASRSARESSTS